MLNYSKIGNLAFKALSKSSRNYSPPVQHQRGIRIKAIERPVQSVADAGNVMIYIVSHGPKVVTHCIPVNDRI
jgi:hypothetical protein